MLGQALTLAEFVEALCAEEVRKRVPDGLRLPLKVLMVKQDRWVRYLALLLKTVIERVDKVSCKGGTGLTDRGDIHILLYADCSGEVLLQLRPGRIGLKFVKRWHVLGLDQEERC